MFDDVVARKCDPNVGVVEISYDPFCENPLQDWDHVGHIVMVPHFSNFCTESGVTTEDYDSEDMKKVCQYTRDGGLYVPIYAYEHGGVSFSLSPFGDPWDSGCAGFFYVTPEEAEKTWGHMTPEQRKVACMTEAKSLVSLMNAYAGGECYIMTLYDTDFNEVESLGGIWYTGYKTEQDFWSDLAHDAPVHGYEELIKSCSFGDIDPVETHVVRSIPGRKEAVANG